MHYASLFLLPVACSTQTQSSKKQMMDSQESTGPVLLWKEQLHSFPGLSQTLAGHTSHCTPVSVEVREGCSFLINSLFNVQSITSQTCLFGPYSLSFHPQLTNVLNCHHVCSALKSHGAQIRSFIELIDQSHSTMLSIRNVRKQKRKTNQGRQRYINRTY